MSEQANKGYNTTMNLITTLSQLPLVRVNRDEFLKNTFKKSEHLDRILAEGPQAVFTSDSLRKKANEIIQASTNSTSVASFVAGLPSNIAVAIAAGGADLTQYFGFALNLAQQLAYLFGEDDLFTGGHGDVSEQTKGRIVAYLGVMLGAGGAASLLVATSKKAAEVMGKKVAAKALTKTAWYPLLKKVAAWIGIKITKQSVGKAVTKAVPVIGGFFSAGITYFTFKPMGNRLADVFKKNMDGEFDIEMVLKDEIQLDEEKIVAETEECEEVIDSSNDGQDQSARE